MKHLTVLSLFDGISCGRIALERIGIPIKKYYASEIKKSAIKCSLYNYPDIIQIGDITKVKGGNYQADLIIGGSCCQDFSLISGINCTSDGLLGEKSKLFYEYLRILKEERPKYYLLENVKMKKIHEKLLTDFLMEVYPDTNVFHINSSLVSFQKRPRIYWTNIPNVTIPEDRNIDFQDYKDTDFDYCEQFKVNRTPSREKMWGNGKGKNQKGVCANITNSNKIYCITRKQDRFPNSGLIEHGDFCRYLTRRELELGQTLPLGYTDCLSYNQMQDVCGDGWTVDVIAHIFQGLKNENI